MSKKPGPAASGSSKPSGSSSTQMELPLGVTKGPATSATSTLAPTVKSALAETLRVESATPNAPPLSDVEIEWFGMKFEGNFLRKRGMEFQDYFADLMDAAYPGDFERIRPYGKLGDRKCDGFLRSRNIIFQVYGPREMRLAELKSKVREDFAGAQEHWAGMLGWVFVHNDPEGLPADIVKLLDELGTKNPAMNIETWGQESLQQLVSRVPRSALIRLFGRPPSRKDFDVLGFDKLSDILATIRSAEVMTTLDEIRPVSPKKIEANALSATTVAFLTLGRQRDRLVEQYFEKHPNPSFGEEVAMRFRHEYQRLRAEALTANQIFTSLLAFTSGSTRGDPDHEAAALAVLSYLFDRCDIFEAPPEVKQQ